MARPTPDPGHAPPDGSVTVALDVGGTKVAGGLVTAVNDVLLPRHRPTLVDGRRDPGLKVTLGLALELLAEARARGLAIDGIGAGFPEYVDPSGELRSHEVLAWVRQPRDLLGDLVPATIESDVRCAALGEAAAGVARGLESFAFVIVGTGLSYALVEDGRARTGARGEAIALGELEVSRHVDPAAAVILERYASGEAIRERYGTLSGREVAGAADVVRRADNGDRAAQAVVATAAQALGEGLATLVRLIDPGALVIGGGVAGAGAAWRVPLLAAYGARVAARPSPPPVLWAALGSEGAIVGAAIAHRRRLSEVPSS
jgi:glucokinase